MNKMIDMCPVKGTKGRYVHDMKSKVYTATGREIKADEAGNYELLIAFKPIKLSFIEIFPYKPIKKKSK